MEEAVKAKSKTRKCAPKASAIPAPAPLREFDSDILDNARRGNDQRQFLAVAVLSKSPTDYKFCFVVNEYGDGEGERMTRDFVEECIEEGLVHADERLEVVLYEVTDMKRCAFSFDDEASKA